MSLSARSEILPLTSFATKKSSHTHNLLTVPKHCSCRSILKIDLDFPACHKCKSLRCIHMANLPEQLQKSIEPIIKDFIDSMELGVPHCVVTSEKRKNNCLVIVRVKKGVNYKHSFFKMGFTISTCDDVFYLKKNFGHYLRSLEILSSFKQRLY